MAGNDSFYEAYVSIIPSAKGFEKSLNKQLGGPSTAAGATAGATAGGGFVGAFGKAIPVIGGVLAAAGIGDIIGNAITDASTYQQAQGAVEQVYGQLGADAITAFADGGAKTVGQSANDILSSASLIGIFGKAAGLADAELVDFSTSLITLGADLSAFANTTPQEAVEALGAGLRGEAEPLRKYGVLLDDAALKSRAMELGIYDGSGALTQQQRILAAHAEIMAQTSDQQGQYARESDTLAGKQAALAASWENLSTRMGEAFLPVAQEVLGYLMDEGIPAFEEFVNWLNAPETAAGFEAVADGARLVAGVLKQLGIGFVDTAGLIGGVAAYLNGQINFNELVAKMLELPGFWGMVYRAANDAAFRTSAAVSNIVVGVQRMASDIGLHVGNAVRWFQGLPGRIRSALGGAGMWLWSVGSDIIAGLVNGVRFAAGNVIAAVSDVVGGAINHAKALLGINSPSKVFASIGSDTARGFAVGVESEYSTVRNATKGMTSAAVDATGDTYVQNPFTGDYLLARTAEVASGVVSKVTAAQQRGYRGRVQTI